MNDRELLELAAKAAGVKIDKSPFNGGGHGNTGFDALGRAVLDWHNGVFWSPLTDDGDALRLAACLGLMVDCSIPGRTRCAGPRSIGLEEYFIDGPTANQLAATRRAIVRAAAEIGKTKEHP